jgi:disulfide oxidoreductase YuzD
MITNSVTYDGEDRLLVDAFDGLDREAKQGDYWSDETLASLKARVKTHYIAAQKYRCCYCDRHRPTDNHREWDVEHVADRSKYPWFMFTPRNLAAACPECNGAKQAKETLTSVGRKTYPDKPDGFRIVHPHFDDYADHIFRKGMVYLPKTAKGRKTIYMCNLLRFAEKHIDWTNEATDIRFEAEVDAVFEGGSAVAQTAVETIIARLPIPD